MNTYGPTMQCSSSILHVPVYQTFGLSSPGFNSHHRPKLLLINRLITGQLIDHLLDA